MIGGLMTMKEQGIIRVKANLSQCCHTTQDASYIPATPANISSWRPLPLLKISNLLSFIKGLVVGLIYAGFFF